MSPRAVVRITGVVQGVGFRPFLFNRARERGLKGTIQNKGNFGVEAHLEGTRAALEAFVEGLGEALPSIAYVEDVQVTWETGAADEEENGDAGEAGDDQIEGDGTPRFTRLEIVKSSTGRGRSLVLPPDIGICEACARDYRDPGTPRFHEYPFVACAGCGPRFTTVRELPYDRERTTMDAFPFCPDCQREYDTPADRRFHAQTFACKVCGPQYAYHAYPGGAGTGGMGRTRPPPRVETDDPVGHALAVIAGGGIVAVKSLGGVHLVCRADDPAVVAQLRARKRKRKRKPFAVMAPDVATVARFARVTPAERALLTSFRKPIVLLQKGPEFAEAFADNVAPGLDTVGVLLPYMGLHLAFFDRVAQPGLIFTSGNASNLPMATTNADIFSQLAPLADGFLVHDRVIHQRCDDSVVKVLAGVPKIIRRSRGYVPEYVPLPFRLTRDAVVAVGPELHSTSAVLKRHRVFPTQHVGNVTNLETYHFLRASVAHLKALLDVPDARVRHVACDAHPQFYSTRLARDLAREYDAAVTPVYHHHAHAAGLMAENGVPLDEEVVVLTLDGVGYGADERAWGGEVLACTYAKFERVGHLAYQPMVGGDACVRYPARMLASILFPLLGVPETGAVLREQDLVNALPHGDRELETMGVAYARGEFPRTSSTGRVLDAAAALLGACRVRSYDGEPAMRLEALARVARPVDREALPRLEFPRAAGRLDVPGSREGRRAVAISPGPLFEALVEETTKGEALAPRRRAALAHWVHVAVARNLTAVACAAARERGAARVGLSGGVAYNAIIHREVKQGVHAAGLEYLEHRRVPPGDAGVSVGQVAVTVARHYA